jgi:hypothetical protein
MPSQGCAAGWCNIRRMIGISSAVRKGAATLALIVACTIAPAARAQETSAAATNGAALDCQSPRFRDGIGCITPRDGTVSGGYIGLDIGLITLKDSAKQRVQAGSGPAAQFRLGIEFWDVLLAGIGIGFGRPNDHASYTEQVVDCEYSICDSTPHAQGSVVKAPFFNLEVGAQHRFRPFANGSLSTGIALGQSFGLGGMVREVNCSGCASHDLDGSSSGTYLAPFFRITFGRLGIGGVIVRSMWYVTGDLQQITTVGGELGLP